MNAPPNVLAFGLDLTGLSKLRQWKRFESSAPLSEGGVDYFCTPLYSYFMDTQSKGAEEARNQLPDLLNDAEQGKSTVITRHGKPVAALVPIKDFKKAPKQPSILDLRGSGRGLWGKDSTAFIRKLRDEWER